jgi:hypothetical protein
MVAHLSDQPLPQFLAAFLVNRFVADDRKLVRARRDEDENGVSFRRFLHPEPVKSFLRRRQRIDLQLAALNENADLSGCFRFRVANCFHNPIVFELAEKFLGSHRVTSFRSNLHHQSFLHLR